MKCCMISMGIQRIQSPLTLCNRDSLTQAWTKRCNRKSTYASDAVSGDNVVDNGFPDVTCKNL